LIWGDPPNNYEKKTQQLKIMASYKPKKKPCFLCRYGTKIISDYTGTYRRRKDFPFKFFLFYPYPSEGQTVPGWPHTHTHTHTHTRGGKQTQAKHKSPKALMHQLTNRRLARVST
jgi:hypothetical protein